MSLVTSYLKVTVINLKQSARTQMDEDRITTIEKTQKIKDPRKVKAGKRLAALSKEVKEKARE